MLLAFLAQLLPPSLASSNHTTSAGLSCPSPLLTRLRPGSAALHVSILSCFYQIRRC